MPHSAEEMTATFAGPPAKRPVMLLARLMKNSETPVRSRNAPKIVNTTMNFEQALIGVPSTPVVLKNSSRAASASDCLLIRNV